jgi:hypothetical protein
MAGQLNRFFQKFYSLLQAGNDARLNVECHAGNAQIHLRLNLHHQPHLQPQHQPRHQPSPSLNIIPAVNKDPLASVAAPNVSLPVQQLLKLPFMMLKLQAKMTPVPSPSHTPI